MLTKKHPGRFVMTLVMFMALTMIAGCGSNNEAEFDLEATKITMSTEVVATITAEAAEVATPTAPPKSVDKSLKTTLTQERSSGPTVTSARTPTRRPTNTPQPSATPTPTPTPLPGLGDTVQCGNLWEISAISEPDFSGILTDDPPKGTYAKLYFRVKNLQNGTASLG